MNLEVSAEMKLNDTAYSISQKFNFNKTLSNDDVIQNINSIKDQTDQYLQEILDNNKFLLNIPQTKEDDEDKLNAG